ncbi:MAG: biotin/lipoyl-containing protein, partial [Acidobacteriota bacterium]
GNQFTMQVTNEGEASERQPQAYRVRLIEAEDGRLVAEIDGVRRRFHIGEIGQHVAVHGAGCGSELEAISRFPQRAVSAVAGGCAAPMTGRIVEVRVAAGQQVAAGDTLVVLEAMKMEHQLQAAAGGVVAAVHVEAGQMVDPDKVLVVVEPQDDTAASDVQEVS